jgi:DinB family protein
MSDLNSAIADNHKAVDEFTASARAVDTARWTIPRGDGKWSPAQVVEHIALTYEYSRAVLNNSAPGPSAPRVLRPLVRMFFVNPVLKRGRFKPNGRAPAMFQPSSSPDGPVDLLSRLETAVRTFEDEVRAANQSGRATLDHPFFGTMPVADYLRLQAIHARHHRAQLPDAAATR